MAATMMFSGVLGILLGCGSSNGSGSSNTLMPVIQAALDGASVTKYAEAVPVWSGKRIDGKSAVKVDMVEFQQKILPADFYAGLAAPYNAGTYLWGYAINGGAASFPSATIEVQKGTPTAVTYPTSRKGAGGGPTVLAKYITTDLTV